MRGMRAVGAYGGGSLDQIISHVLDDVVTHLNQSAGKPVDVQKLANSYTINVLLALVRYQLDQV